MMFEKANVFPCRNYPASSGCRKYSTYSSIRFIVELFLVQSKIIYNT